MKYIILILLFTTILSAKATIMLEQDVVMMVNGVKITKTELDKGVKALFPARYYHGTISDEKLIAFEKEVLDELLENELIFQHAKSIGITISQSKIDESIEKLKKILKTQKRFEEVLQKTEYTLKTFRKAIYREEIIKKFNKENIEVNLGDNELKDYYEKNKYKFKEPERIVAKIIYVRTDPTDLKGKSKAKDRIKEAYKKINDGQDFADIAAEYSTSMSRIKGGDLGYIHKGMLEPAVEKKAFAMDANTTSEIIEEEIGFFIVKVEKIIKANQLPFDLVKEKLAKDLKKKIEKEKKESLLKKLKSVAVIIK